MMTVQASSNHQINSGWSQDRESNHTTAQSRIPQTTSNCVCAFVRRNASMYSKKADMHVSLARTTYH